MARPSILGYEFLHGLVLFVLWSKHHGKRLRFQNCDFGALIYFLDNSLDNSLYNW